MRLKLFPIALLSLAILMLVVLQCTYGLFTSYSYLTAQWDRRESTLQLLSYGLPAINQKQQVAIANEMGFDIKPIAGCFISQAAINGAEQYNKVMSKALTVKLGSGWKLRFDRKVDSLFRHECEARIYEAVMNYGDVRTLIRQADSIRPGLRYIKVINPSDTNKLHPNAWLCQDAKVGYYVLRYYRVDPYTLRIGQIMY